MTEYKSPVAEALRLERDAALAEVERLRARVHEAVDETQRRYAKYQSRCDDFARWSKWARDWFEKNGGKGWFWAKTSEAYRLLVQSLLEEVESERSSRQAWAEEALRLEDVLEGRRRQVARALNMHPLASWDELQTTGTTYAEEWLDNIAAQIDAEERAKRAEPPTGVCACLTDEQADQLANAGSGFTRPQCTVHPGGGA